RTPPSTLLFLFFTCQRAMRQRRPKKTATNTGITIPAQPPQHLGEDEAPWRPVDEDGLQQALFGVNSGSEFF
ncbi:hypothetical protein, partial [Microvirga brassicacearum]|uniref:hypothetical protein n=1 Tax=Microvirga brassicacearum TaxID=2580413 RepID=UPI001AED717D